MKLEGSVVHLADVCGVLQFEKVVLQLFQLVVVLVVLVWKDGDAVLRLQAVGEWGVVDQDHLRQASVDYSEVFDDALREFVAGLSVDSVLEDGSLRIDEIEYSLCVWSESSSKYYKLKTLTESL